MLRHSDSVCKAVEWLLNLSKTAAYPNGENSLVLVLLKLFINGNEKCHPIDVR